MHFHFFLVFSLLFILCPIQNVSASDASTLELGDDIVATSSYRVKSKTKKADTYGSWTTVASKITGASKNGEVLGAVVDMSWSNSITGGISLSYTSNNISAAKTEDNSADFQVGVRKSLFEIQRLGLGDRLRWITVLSQPDL